MILKINIDSTSFPFSAVHLPHDLQVVEHPKVYDHDEVKGFDEYVILIELMQRPNLLNSIQTMVVMMTIEALEKLRLLMLGRAVQKSLHEQKHASLTVGYPKLLKIVFIEVDLDIVRKVLNSLSGIDFTIVYIGVVDVLQQLGLGISVVTVAFYLYLE